MYAPNVFVAAEYAIDQNLAPVISFSFGGCEKVDARRRRWCGHRAVAQQANAQGITWVASPATPVLRAARARGPTIREPAAYSVNLPASFPEVTGVGGTMFAEGTGNYWASGYTKAAPSALSYIPEAVWNETPGGMLAASEWGGERLLFEAGLADRPGLPAGNARMVPDVSFAAGWNHDPYIPRG